MYGGRAPKGELCNKVCMYVFRAQATPAGHVRDQN